MKKTLLFFILWALSFSTHAQNCTLSVGNDCVFNSAGTYTLTVPADVIVDIQAWGAGGGSPDGNGAKGGGGGGAFAQRSGYELLASGSPYTVTVGQGGSANTAGEDSSIPSIIFAAGGGKGGNDGGSGGIFSTGDGDTGKNGGNGGGGEGNNGDGGGGGGSGGSNSHGGNGETGGDPLNSGAVVAAGGAAGGSNAGKGGDGGDASNTPAPQNGAFPGGGAGGKGAAGTTSGNGADGQIIISAKNLGPLPVELTSFESKVIDNNSVILFWNTASEKNNSHFVIEHSRDGQRFNEIGQKTGMGTTTIPHTYSKRHERLAKGFHYYRLKQVDFDGKYEYSNIISAKLELTLKDVSIAPNPAMEKVTVFIDTPISIAASYQLVNMQKEIMLERTVAEGNSSFQIDMTDLPAGVYFMRFYVDQQVISKKIVKLY